MNQLEPYDLFVIGAGPGGYTAALLGAKRGMRVGIAEGSAFGGTCTNTGCIPAKSYIESVNLFSRMKNAQRFGIAAPGATISLEDLNRRKTRIVTRLVKGIEHLLARAGVDIFRGLARFESGNSILVGETRVVSRSTVIATGSRPKRPALFNLEGVMSSEDIFALRQAPASLLIVGGGVIGLEMAHVFSHLGSEVTVVEAMDRILATEDEEVSRALVSLYRRVRFITSARITGVDKGQGFTVKVQTPQGSETITGDDLLLCIGRAPVIPDGLRSLGLELTPEGGIKVDLCMRTCLPGLYAIGDVTGTHMYAYVASKEAEVAVENISGGSATIDYASILR
jgi:dihydrolipoamide dehydrogenase